MCDQNDSKQDCDAYTHEVIASVKFDENGEATIRLKTNFGLKVGDKIPLKNCPGASIEIVGPEGCNSNIKNGHAII